jgi:hypothetical protein
MFRIAKPDFSVAVPRLLELFRKVIVSPSVLWPCAVEGLSVAVSTTCCP